MTDELEICTAAFFRIKGKDVVTVKEFTMSVSLEFKWMSAKNTEALMKTLISKGLVTKTGDYLKPGKDFSSVRVPIAYRPSEELLKSLSGTDVKTTPKTVTQANPDIFMELMTYAEKNGISKGKFVSESNAIKKKIGIETSVAGLILLRDNGIDIEEWVDRVYTQVLNK